MPTQRSRPQSPETTRSPNQPTFSSTLTPREFLQLHTTFPTNYAGPTHRGITNSQPPEPTQPPSESASLSRETIIRTRQALSRVTFDVDIAALHDTATVFILQGQFRKIAKLLQETLAQITTEEHTSRTLSETLALLVIDWEATNQDIPSNLVEAALEVLGTDPRRTHVP